MPVVKRLREYLPEYKIALVDDFLSPNKQIFLNQTNKEILVLENIRFTQKKKIIQQYLQNNLHLWLIFMSMMLLLFAIGQIPQ